MTEKKINIYAAGFIQADINNTQLVGELGSNYIIMLLSDISGKEIIAYEYFEFDILNSTWNNIFDEIKLSSKILTKRYSASRLFYNFPETLVVPSLYDNKDNAKIYLNTFYNSVKNNTIEVDKLQAFDNVSVIYSVEEDIKQAVKAVFNPAEVHHTYSKLLQNISQTQQHSGLQQCFHLFFYNQMFVMAVTNGSQLAFIKSVNYHSPDDVLYFILNVAKQHNVNTAQLQLKVSGFINYDSAELIILQKYFAPVVMEEPLVIKPLNKFFEGFPQQYFTPLFYLLA